MHATFQRTASAIAATTAASLLLACGGSGDSAVNTSSTDLKAGDVLTLESITGSDTATRQSHSFLMHAVTAKGELVDVASADQITGALVPLRLPNLNKATSTDGAAEPSLAELRDFYKALSAAKARRDGKLIASAVLEEITDLDDDIATLYADQQRSGLNLDAYLGFYATFDENPWFAAQENAEGELRDFIEDANYELQGPSCPNHYYMLPGKCVWIQPKTQSAATVWNQAEIQNAMATRGGLTSLLSHMSSLGMTFAELTTVFHAWRAENPNNAALSDFIDYAMALPKPGRNATTKSTNKLCALDSSGTTPITQIRLMDHNRIYTEADGAWDCLVSAKDLDPSHYTGAQVARSTPSVLSFKKDGMLLAQVTISQRVHYDGVSPASPYRWLPRITADVQTHVFNDALKLSATLAVTPINAYESSTTKPAAGVWLETEIEPGRGSMLNAPRQIQRIQFNGTTRTFE
jgi:hypothetical protein